MEINVDGRLTEWLSVCLSVWLCLFWPDWANEASPRHPPHPGEIHHDDPGVEPHPRRSEVREVVHWAVDVLSGGHAHHLAGTELPEMFPEFLDVVHQENVRVKKDPSIHLGQHEVYEEPGSGAHPEHADHVLEPQGVPDLNNGHRSHVIG